MSRSKSGMGGGKSKSKSSSKAHEMHIKRAHGGGYVVTHHKAKKHPMDDSDPETHVVPDAEALQAHVQGAMGDQPPAGTPMPDPNAQAAAPQAMPPQGM